METLKELATPLREQGLSYRQVGESLGISKQKAYRLCNKEEISARRKEARKLSPEKYKERNRAWSESNPEKVKSCSKKWRANNRDSINSYHKEKYASDINYRLSKCLRARLNLALIKGQKSGSAVRDLGCSIEELKQHLEYLFQDGMSWENYGQWHVDHIRPLASFNLEDRNQLLQACHYTNLQPLWAADNMSKGGRYGQVQ